MGKITSKIKTDDWNDIDTNGEAATEATLQTVATNTAALAMSVENALSATTYDLNAAAYSGTTSITSDYILDSIALDFSTTQSKTITITTAQGTKLYEDTNTVQNLIVEFKQSFNASENITVAVTQTAGACTMDLRLKVTKGSNTLLGNPSLGASTERIGKVDVRFEDTEAIDAFGRLRVSNPKNLFESQFLYNLLPLIFEPITNGSGATITHDATNRTALMTFSSTPTGGKSYMQSYSYLHYQAGKSQAIDISFGFVESKANCLKFVGYSDGVNGMEFQNNGTTNQFVVYSGTGSGDQTATQANWNIDKLDGTGTSGITLDITKEQIIHIDFQALKSGRVRFGFNLGGKIIYAHQFNFANTITTPYIQNPNLPIRVGMTCTGTVSTTMNFSCSTVVSEGGSELTQTGLEFSQNFSVTAASGVATHALSLRPKTTFNGITNRHPLSFIEFDMLVTGSNPVQWEIVLGQAITGTTTFIDSNTTYSSMEYNILGTASGTPTIKIDESFVPSSNQSKGLGNMDFSFRYPITLDAAGLARANGTITILVTGLGGSSAVRGALKWVENR